MKLDSEYLNIQLALITVIMQTDDILGSLLQYKKAGADGLMGAMPANEQGEGPHQYSEKLSPAVNHFLAEASRQDVRVRLLLMMIVQILAICLLYVDISLHKQWTVLPLHTEVECWRISSGQLL